MAEPNINILGLRAQIIGQQNFSFHPSHARQLTKSRQLQLPLCQQVPLGHHTSIFDWRSVVSKSRGW